MCVCGGGGGGGKVDRGKGLRGGNGGANWFSDVIIRFSDVIKSARYVKETQV